MKHEGPELDTLLRRLAECPAEFLETPQRGGSGTIDVAAIVGDHLRDMGEVDVSAIAKTLRGYGVKRLQLIAIATWLLNDSWFRQRYDLVPSMRDLLTSDELGMLAHIVRAEVTVTDADRREELVRFCLNRLNLRPRGESIATAQDRLNSLDSVERERVVRETRAAETRARKIREEMAKRAAQEAAARYSPE